MPETAPIPIVPDPRQPALFDAVPIPPKCSMKELDSARTITNGIVKRLEKLPPVLTKLILEGTVYVGEFHKASVAANYIMREFKDVKDDMAKWILSCAAAELERPEDNGEPVP